MPDEESCEVAARLAVFSSLSDSEALEDEDGCFVLAGSDFLALPRVLEAAATGLSSSELASESDSDSTSSKLLGFRGVLRFLDFLDSFLSY